MTGKGLAASLVSYGYPDVPNRIFGPYFGSLARQLYEATQVRCKGRIATIVGTPGGERLEGTRRRDVIAAGSGADVVVASAKRDLVCGGAGADRLLGGGGADRLNGGSGADFCGGGGGRDRASGCAVRRKVP